LADLKQSGVNAQTAKQLVDQYIKSIENIPASKALQLTETATGTWSVNETVVAANPKNQSLPGGSPGGVGAAGGGLVTGGSRMPRADDIPARLSHGEYVVQASAVDKYGTGFLDSVNAMHFADGGYTGDLSGLGAWTQGQYNATTANFTAAVEAAVMAALASAKASAGPGVNVNFFGTTVPGPEQMHAITTQLSAAIGVS